MGNFEKDKNRVRAEKIHYDNGAYGGACGTEHGKVFTSSKLPSLVTCKRCLHLISLSDCPKIEQLQMF